MVPWLEWRMTEPFHSRNVAGIVGNLPIYAPSRLLIYAVPVTDRAAAR